MPILNLLELPYFILLNIIDYTIVEDKKYATLCKLWLKRTFQRFAQIEYSQNNRVPVLGRNPIFYFQQLQNPRLKRSSSEISSGISYFKELFNDAVEFIVFDRYNNISWNRINKDNIKRLKIYTDENLANQTDFIANLISFKNLRVLEIISKFNLTLKIDYSFINHLRRLTDLNLDSPKLKTEQYKQIFDSTVYYSLTSFYLKCSSKHHPLTFISKSLPNIRVFKVLVHSFNKVPQIVFDSHMSKVVELEIVNQYSWNSGLIKLDLACYPSLKKLALSGNARVFNSGNVPSKVESLAIKHSDDSLLDDLLYFLPILKHISLDIGTIIFQKNQPSVNFNKFMSLCFHSVANTNLFVTEPLEDVTLRRLEIHGSGFLSQYFFDWISQKTQIKILVIDDDADVVLKNFNCKRFDNLEILVVGVRREETRDFLKQAFCRENCPKLKLIKNVYADSIEEYIHLK